MTITSLEPSIHSMREAAGMIIAIFISHEEETEWAEVSSSRYISRKWTREAALLDSLKSITLILFFPARTVPGGLGVHFQHFCTLKGQRKVSSVLRRSLSRKTATQSTKGLW